MVDIKVQQVQEWLLSTYGNRSEFAQFVKDYDFKVTGNTGNSTMVALVMALQYELGISGPSGSFGPTTIRLAPKISLANADTFSSNIIKILEGGLWCHGYSAGYKEPSVGEGVDFGGTYDEDTDAAIKKLQADIGISQSGRFDGYLWKALLSTDAFVTTWTNGSPKIREAQQYLNSLAINGYYFADDFIGSYLPTDGLNNRAFSKALVLYIQANQGIFASEATGNLGPATQAGLVTIPDNLPSDSTKSRHFVRAAVFALLANGYDVTINSYWSEETSNVVSQFQRDMILPVTGKVDFSTWMSLLVSYGNINRSHTACDTRFEITDTRLDKLKSMGIKIVGRYLTGGDFKELRVGEVERIIDAGLGLIPIYQENGRLKEEFTYEQGRVAAVMAQEAATQKNIPSKSIIYFAVDFDAQDPDITSNIIPYFQGVRTALLNDSKYEAGIYGTRNVCQRVLKEVPEIKTSYVSNMSSGWSGNLGFKMPSDWNFDQFDEITIDDWGIDRVIYSGKHPFVSEYVGMNYTETNFTDKPLFGDNFDKQAEVYVYAGTDEIKVYSTRNGLELIGPVIGVLKKGQIISMMGSNGTLYPRRIVFTASNGKSAYGYVNTDFNNAVVSTPNILKYEDLRSFKKCSYDEKTNQHITQEFDPETKLTKFTTKRKLKMYDSNGKNEVNIPENTKVYIDNSVEDFTIAGKKNPHHLLIHKIKLEGGTIQDIPGENGYGFLDLDFQNGSLNATCSLW